MIEYMKPTDSIFDSGAEALVCPVNCVGVMGAGLAKEFKERYNGLFANYRRKCEGGYIRIGSQLEECAFGNNRRIVYFPTKAHWKDKSSIEDVRSGLNLLIKHQFNQFNIHAPKSIAIPALGCGLGGLDWNDVRPLIEEAFKALPDVRVMLYPPKEEEI